uniref:VWFA domain-containing protein n=1 Tax=Acrobeloides nanus TaxID=290746 RepID=A0A914CYX3_9BILA
MKPHIVLVLFGIVLSASRLGASRLDANDTYFPCNKYFTFIVDKSGGLTPNQFKAQINFIINYLFNTSQWEGFDIVPWNHPERISIIAYDSVPTTYPFGSFSSMSVVVNTLQNLVQTMASPLLNKALYEAASQPGRDCNTGTQTISFTSTNDKTDIGRASYFAPDLQQTFIAFELMNNYWTNVHRLAYISTYNDVTWYTDLVDFNSTNVETVDALRAIINTTTPYQCSFDDVPYTTLLQTIVNRYHTLATLSPTDIPEPMVDFYVILFVTNDLNADDVKVASKYASLIPYLTIVAEGNTDTNLTDQLSSNVIYWPSINQGAPNGDWKAGFMNAFGCGKQLDPTPTVPSTPRVTNATVVPTIINNATTFEEYGTT